MRTKNLMILSVILILGAAAAACSILPNFLRPASDDIANQIDTMVEEAKEAVQDTVNTTTETVEQATMPAAALPQDGTAVIVGSFEYTNEFYPEDYAHEHAVALLDLTGFILRDERWEIPVESQVLGYLDVDEESNLGKYQLMLPLEPKGTLNDLNHDSSTDMGVQVYAIEYAPNWIAGPFYDGDDVYWGWPSYLASVITDTENQDEIIGGKVIIWAPDAMQSFPSGFGEDGLLFTADDPIMPVPAGYSVIDLDQQPFDILRDREAEVLLYEPSDAAIKDLTNLSFTEAFDTLFETARKEYAFSGIAGKAPDWDAMYADLKPKVEQAQKSNNAYDFYLALRAFVLSFSDGHVGINGGDLEGQWVSENIIAGYGFAIRELSDGTVIVVYLMPDGPADQAGMQLGAEIVSLSGKPIAQAISETEPYTPQSTDFGLRYEQSIFVLRDPLYTVTEVEFINPNSARQSAVLTSTYEFDSLYATYLGGDYDEVRLPIEYDLLEAENIGYVRINSNSDDLNLSYRLFERAMATFDEYQVNGVIIDMRLDFGGTSFNLAGYLSEDPIPMGQSQYYSDLTGQFEPEGIPTVYEPMETIYDFPKVILLVDQFCFSACELDAYALSQVDGVTVMGEFPTAGVEAETARGKFDLPGGISITIPTGRFVLPDGSILLEGQGVEPDIRLEVTAESVLSPTDTVLQRAIEEILK
ncbi:MAG: hypothetical protein JW750_03925 [Anaerolineaceae bacterium]|nr:hypothetical protein [Anaerolineaceae bacterium]